MGHEFILPLPAKSVGDRWPEDFSILVTEQEWYLNFHVAAGLQQDIVLNVFAQCLHAAGIPGTLEEV
jgi:hypothetical protein